jgi:hypothetical protein
LNTIARHLRISHQTVANYASPRNTTRSADRESW